MICVHCDTPLPDGSKFCSQCGADPSDPGSGPRTRASGNAQDLFARLQAALGARYQVEQLLGRGGMGAVFLATDVTLERPVAIKVLPPELSHDEKFVGRFEREARTAAKLDHSSIIPIYAVEHAEGLYYFVMKYVTGKSLDHVLAGGAMPMDVGQRILWESACALGHAHQRGVVHRDIKPANIMIDDSGHAMLTDFGISKALQAATQFTATGQVIGTPHYMSPEQAKGLQVDGRSDLYSLGVVGFRMLTGRLPFADDSVHTVIYKHIFEDPEPVETLRPDVPAFLAAAIRCAMAKDPADRYPTMEAFASAVWPENPVAGPGRPPVVGRTAPSSIEGATQITPPEPGRKRAPMVAVAGAFVVLAAAGGGVWWYVGQGAGGDGRAGVGQTDTTGGGQVAAGPAVVPPAATDTSADAPPAREPPAPVERRTPPREERRPPPRERTDPVQPPAPQFGFLTINAAPFGTVYVDGVEVGDTPVVGHRLSPGRHVIEVRREGYRTVADTVLAVAGNTIRLNKSLSREP